MNLTEHMGNTLLNSVNIDTPTDFFVAPGKYDSNTTIGELIRHFESQKVSAEPTDLVIKAMTHKGSKRAAKGGVIVGPQGWDEVRKYVQAFSSEGATIGDEQTEIDHVFGALVTQKLNIKHEIYLSIAYDRTHFTPKLVLTASTQGGSKDIEGIKRTHPNKVHHLPLDVLLDMSNEKDASKLKENISSFLQHSLNDRSLGNSRIRRKNIAPLTDITLNMYRLVTEKMAELVEINPLIITKKEEIFAADAKIRIDANANSLVKKEIADMVGFPYKIMTTYKRGKPKPHFIALIGDGGTALHETRIQAHEAHYMNPYGDAGKSYVHLPGGNVILFGFGAGIKDMVGGTKVLGLNPLVITEASGDPPAKKCYEWAKAAFNVLDYGDSFDAIVIYGGKAMMTYAVPTLYEGIFKAWREHKHYDPKIPIIMRREAREQERANELIRQTYMTEGMNVTISGTEKNAFQTGYTLISKMKEFIEKNREGPYFRHWIDQREDKLLYSSRDIRANFSDRDINNLNEFLMRYGGFELNQHDKVCIGLTK